VAGKIRRWDVLVLVVAFVAVFGHAHKLTSQIRRSAAPAENILLKSYAATASLS
jgi:hypothetical protein